MSFEELNLSEPILKAVADLGFEQPMPIQQRVIPFLLENEQDVIALAQTGTGKTAAFGLPILEKVDASKKAIQALILAPTRELCVQIATDIKKYAAYLNDIKVVAVYGGENIVSQFKQLDVQPQILVATPGRLIDLINRGKVFLDNVGYLVLDEADEMLNMGFEEDINTILESVPEQRRTLLFSATMPVPIAAIASKYMRQTEHITVGVKNAGAENVEHICYVVAAANRYLALKRIMDMNPDIYSIVFCRTRQETQEVADKLMKDGYNADALHGDLSQAQRDTVMNKFRIRNLQVLVATDVAARGLDVSDLTHVINYNLPDDTEVYTHRSGRTGRAGKKGVSCVIVHSREMRKLRDIERVIKKQFKREPVPTGEQICKRQLFHLIDKMERVEVNAAEIEQFMPQISAKLSYLTKEDIISRFVSMEFNRFSEYYKDAVDINIPEKEKREKPKQQKQGRNNSKKVRFKLLFGAKNNASPRAVLGIINEVTGDRNIMVGDIEITHKFTFFDIYKDQAEAFMQAFAHSAFAKKLSIATEENRDIKQMHDNERDNKKSKKQANNFDREKGKRGDFKKGRGDDFRRGRGEFMKGRYGGEDYFMTHPLDEQPKPRSSKKNSTKPWRKNRR